MRVVTQIAISHGINILYDSYANTRNSRLIKLITVISDQLTTQMPMIMNTAVTTHVAEQTMTKILSENVPVAQCQGLPVNCES